MKEIILTQNQIALVDDENYNWINQYKWRPFKGKRNLTFYASRNYFENGKKKTQLMHRLIMNVSKNFIINHWDYNGLNNQQNNLIIATHQESIRYRKKFERKKFSSKYKGVNWNKNSQKWIARIMVDKKSIFLGYFHEEIEAALAYNEAAKIHHKEFAQLNFLE